MKVLLINGSPNERGCTYTALSEVESELKAAGIDTEIFHIGSAPIQGCMACYKCRNNSNRCVVDDIVNIALDKMEKADGLVIGSPVYYAGINGALCAFLDRFFFSGSAACCAHKPAACVVSARRAGTTAALDRLSKYALISNMPLVPSQYWNMVHGMTPDDVAQDLEGLQTMRALGRNMAWMLKCIEAGKEKGIFSPQPERKYRTNFIR